MDVENLLKDALAPVDPPVDLGDRLESTLNQITASAAEELADWELSSFSDPRNWVKPAAAVAAGSVAGAALLLLRARHKHGGSNQLPEAVADFLKEGRRAAQLGVSLALDKGRELRD